MLERRFDDVVRPGTGHIVAIVFALGFGAAAPFVLGEPPARGTSVPDPRHGVAMAFDPASRRVLLFGGVDHTVTPSCRFGDTWSWDGKEWSTVSNSGPSPRTWPAMAWDGPGHRMLLFGGSDGGKTLDDTWSFDERAWTRLTPQHSPPARWHFAMAFDEARRRVTLFGGVDTAAPEPIVYGDTWVWDGSDWRHASETGPTPRFGHAMTWDPERRTIVLVGGRDKEQRPLNDTWEWDGVRWKTVATSGLKPRVLHGLAFDPNRHSVLLFGGWDVTPAGAYLAETWELRHNRWSKLDVPGPPARRAHFMTLDPRRKRVVLFGGYGADSVIADTWEWNGKRWQKSSPIGPARVVGD